MNTKLTLSRPLKQTLKRQTLNNPAFHLKFCKYKIIKDKTDTSL